MKRPVAELKADLEKTYALLRQCGDVKLHYYSVDDGPALPALVVECYQGDSFATVSFRPLYDGCDSHVYRVEIKTSYLPPVDPDALAAIQSLVGLGWGQPWPVFELGETNYISQVLESLHYMSGNLSHLG